MVYSIRKAMVVSTVGNGKMIYSRVMGWRNGIKLLIY
jgi:hypothetical protein